MKRPPLNRRSAPLARGTSIKRTAFKTHPKPTRITKDGRLILSDYEWRTKQRPAALEAYGGKCGKCNRPITLDAMDLDHKNGRGGGKRDDGIYGPDGTLETGSVWPMCRDCHRVQKHGGRACQ